MRRASRGSIVGSSVKFLTSPAIRIGNPLASNRVISPIPLWPASSARQVVGRSFPSGVTAPRPVITTRRIETSSIQKSGTSSQNGLHSGFDAPDFSLLLSCQQQLHYLSIGQR